MAVLALELAAGDCRVICCLLCVQVKSLLTLACYLNLMIWKVVFRPSPKLPVVVEGWFEADTEEHVREIFGKCAKITPAEKDRNPMARQNSLTTPLIQ